ncbi:MAG: hypothetical protein NT142_10655 [Planctomycetota bacterium]|nr:hypothetical protein [Planctomycetota bacterium]
MKNPINARVQPIGGQQLSANWSRELGDVGGNYDRRDLASMWKNAPTTKISIENLAQNARLKPPTWQQMFGEK